MSLDGVLHKRCVLVTGKGGAGKSTVTAALAAFAARRGKRVLVCEVGDETDGHSPLARMFGRELLPPSPELLTPGIHGATLLPHTGQEMFLASVMHTTTLAHAAMSSEALRRMLNAGPSFREMGVFYHLLRLLRARLADASPEHELVLIDMPATGHTLSLTGLPELLLRLVPRGPIAEALREGQSYLNDPAKGEAWVVTLPETLPISECLELLAGLETTGMPAAGVIVNRLRADPFTPAERAVLRPVLERHEVWGAEAFHRNAVASRELERLRRSTRLPIVELPETASGVLALSVELERQAFPTPAAPTVPVPVSIEAAAPGASASVRPAEVA
ncbi:MAG TPA: ArsA-related P-loop ATPase [Myxococcales bacterium]|jgi:Mrp family chromosome partitioning ATPase